jgi:superfamily II DNA or RNA helicase
VNKDANIVVAHIQALIKRRSRKQERDVASVYPLMEDWVPDLVIVDEGHHKPADSWELIWDEAKRKNPNVKLLALTATPQRGDGKRFGLKSVDQFYLYERWCVVTVNFPFSRHL